MTAHKKCLKKIVKRFEIIILVAALIYFALSAEKRLVTSIMAISQLEARNLANNAIDSAVDEAMKQMNIVSSDFYETDNTNDAVYADTMLINSLCTIVSQNVNQKTDALSRIKIEIPICAALGIDIFANAGPHASFSLKQMGQSTVDYETSFVSSGINQTNFKVWLNVNTEIQMVNPLKSHTVETKRKVMVIDSVIKGNVPDRYYYSN